MVRTHFVFVIFIAALALGCSKKKRVERACDDFCESSAECGGLTGEAENECSTECNDALEDADKDCIESLEDFTDCYSSNSCEELADECLLDAFSLLSNCPELVENSGIDGGGDCCGATDTCDWANDGVCDCSGEASWDSADCADF